MKNLLVPAAIAIGGLFAVNHLNSLDLTNHICSLSSKHDHARSHQRTRNSNVAVNAPEVQSNVIRVAHFAPITEIVGSSLFIEFSDAQTAVSDMEINEQMNLNLVEISLPDTETADWDINNQMEESLVSISIPNTVIADLEMMAGFTTN